MAWATCVDADEEAAGAFFSGIGATMEEFRASRTQRD